MKCCGPGCSRRTRALRPTDATGVVAGRWQRAGRAAHGPGHACAYRDNGTTCAVSDATGGAYYGRRESPDRATSHHRSRKNNPECAGKQEEERRNQYDGNRLLHGQDGIEPASAEESTLGKNTEPHGVHRGRPRSTAVASWPRVRTTRAARPPRCGATRTTLATPNAWPWARRTSPNQTRGTRSSDCCRLLRGKLPADPRFLQRQPRV